MLPEQKLDALLTRHKAIESELSSQLAPETFVKLSREFAELEPVVDADQGLSRRRSPRSTASRR